MIVQHADQVKPAAVVLFDSSVRRTPRPFGKGLLKSLPTQRVDYTAADSAWLSGYRLGLDEIEAEAPAHYSAEEAASFERGQRQARQEVQDHYDRQADREADHEAFMALC